MDSFSYYSEQVHSVFVHGKGQTQRNIVSIQNGTGTKAVETYTADGTKLYRKELPLTKAELHCIQKKQFVPGLFTECIKPLQTKMRSKRTTRRIKH